MIDPENRVNMLSHIVEEHDIKPSDVQLMERGISIGVRLRKAERPSLVLIKGLLSGDDHVADVVTANQSEQITPEVAIGVGIGLLGENRPLYESHLALVEDGHSIGVTATKEALEAASQDIDPHSSNLFMDVTSQLAGELQGDANGLEKLIGAMAGSREILLTERIAA
jgi:hypothetical protein